MKFEIERRVNVSNINPTMKIQLAYFESLESLLSVSRLQQMYASKTNERLVRKRPCRWRDTFHFEHI